MKNVAKIAIIAVVAIILIIVIIFSVKDLSSGADRVMASTPFEKTVESRVKSEIEGKDYMSAGAAFTSIMNYIDTESSITLSNGSSNIRPEEAANAKAIVFNAYAPAVINRGNEIFMRSSWMDSDIKAISTEAERLIKAGGDAALVSQLTNIMNTVKAYREAQNVVASAKKCSTVSSISSLVAKASNYKREPLTNNTSLMSSLDNVGATAKAAVVSSLHGRASNLYKKYGSYGSWESFLKQYNSISDGLDAYIDAYGTTAKVSEAYALINNAYNNADNYYNYNYNYSGYDNYYNY